MNPCPDLTTLDDVNFDEREAHLASCSACRMLFAMRAGGEEEFGEDCEIAETLLAVASDTTLNTIDQRRLSRHLETCGRCTSLAGELLLLDGAAPAKDLALTQAWEPVAGKAPPAQPANDQRSRLFYGLALLTAAAAAILILRGTNSADSTVDVTPERQSKSLASETRDYLDGGSQNSTVGASRPAPVKQLPPALTVAELLEKSSAAMRAADYATSMELCRAALKAEPDNQDAHTDCVLSACNLADPEGARSHIAAITDELQVKVLSRLCQQNGINLDLAPTASADELAEEASASLQEKDYGSARKQCLKALMLDPEHQGARVTCAISECNLHAPEEAQYHHDLLAESSARDRVFKACRKLDVELELVKTLSADEELVRQAEDALKDTKYGMGLRYAKESLKRDPKNQKALTAAAIAACNLKLAKAANGYIAKIESSQRRQGLGQICLRLGVKLSESVLQGTGSSARPPASSTIQSPSIDELAKAASDALQKGEYEKGETLCRQALEREPSNQAAVTACAIAACNLKKSAAAKKYIRLVKSSQRRQGLKQICLRLGIYGFEDESE